MKEVEVVFTRSKKRLPIMSWLIRLYTRKPYSHVAMSHEIRDWGKRYYQASEGKVNYEYETVFHLKHEIVRSYILLLHDGVEREIKKAGYQQCGRKYAFMQNLGILWVDLNKIFGRDIDNPWKEGDNCSELLYTTAFKKTCPELTYNRNKIKPHQIEEIILSKFKRDSSGRWVQK